MSVSYQQSDIWVSSLAARPDDANDAERSQLRNSFEVMRRNVEPLVATAHKDCEGLTVHDVSHLDALWHTASTICGKDYEITPAEAFVLGGAILLHDAGMAVASYKGGLPEIRQTPEWRDAFTVALRQGNYDSSSLPTNVKSLLEKQSDFV